ncbi:MAG: metallophosphoesterase [Solirubrobacteraceae bacterium]
MAITTNPSGASPKPSDDGKSSPPARKDRGLEERCCAAVGLGWQMAELYSDSLPKDEEVPPPAAVSASTSDLPGAGHLRDEEKLELRLGQIEHGLESLARPTADPRLADLLDCFRRDCGDEAGDLDGAVLLDLRRKGELSEMMRGLHEKIVSALTITDFRLGKSYSLGCDLANVTREGQTDEEFVAHLDPKYLGKLIPWCLDLKTALPEHTGQGVADSLRRWRNWSLNRPWETVERADFDRRLRRQGQRWRAILTGEKAARDLLTTTSYIQAAEQLLADAAHVGFGFMKKFWWALLIAAMLLAGGIYLLTRGNGGGNLIGGIAGIAASLGITWKTATPALTNVAEKLGTPLWGAELDTAIATAVTDPSIPAGAGSQLEVVDVAPPPVGAATDRQLARKAVREVWKSLDFSTRRRALGRGSPLKALAYRLPALRSRSPRPFMPHDRYTSHVQSLLEERVAGKRLETSALTTDQLNSEFGPNDFGWMKTGVEACLTWLEDSKAAFGQTPAEEELGEQAVIVLFADWATSTEGARRLAARITERLEASATEHHLIHLGDVYYCGLPDEYKSRFLKYWPAKGIERVRSWNLNGNHDMYSGGQGYFSLVSEDGGKIGPEAKAFAHQKRTSYFCLRNDHWQIIGLDSAYIDNDLAPEQMGHVEAWVNDDGAPARKTILLSHHQLGSSHAPRDVSAGIRDKTKRIRESGRVHAWFWGHEHRCVAYREYLGVKCPVLIGNGGVPELLSSGVLTLTGAFQAVAGFFGNLFARARHPFVRRPRVDFEPQPVRDGQGYSWEPLGFVVISLNGPRGKAIYVNDDGEEHEISLFTV